MRSDSELDKLYEKASPHNGWMTSLLEEGMIDLDESRYLSWRDDQDAPVKATIKAWEAQIEEGGGLDLWGAETPLERLKAITARIGIMEHLESCSYSLAEAFRELFGYQRLLSWRAVIKLELSEQLDISADMIAHARLVRLDKLLKGRLVRGFMKCPSHTEKHSSFYVTSFGYCFGCQRSWNAIDWLMEFEQMTFPQAIQFLLKDTSI